MDPFLYIYQNNIKPNHKTLFIYANSLKIYINYLFFTIAHYRFIAILQQSYKNEPLFLYQIFALFVLFYIPYINPNK